MGDAGTLSVAAQDTLTGAGVQTVTGAKTFNDQKLVYRNPAGTFSLTARTPAILSDLDYLVGRLPYTFFVLADGGVFKCVDCATGGIISSNSSAATVLQYALTNIPATGGSIFINAGDYDLGSTGLTLTLAANKPIDIGGCGHATKIRLSSGTGNILTTSGTSSSLQYLKIHDIMFAGGTSALTTNRHGINFAHNGPTAYLDNVLLKYFDIALFISDANSIYSRNLKVQVANTGVKSNLGANTEPNGLKFENSFLGGCVNYGFDMWSDATGTGSVISIDGADIAQCGTGIKVSGAVREISIGPTPIYCEANTVVDIHIAGTSTSVYPRAVNIANVRCSGTVAPLANMIKLDFCGNVIIQNCVAFNYSDAMILCNAAGNHYKLTIINPQLDGTTPYLINTPSDNFMTSANDRIFGTVIEPHRQGQILSTSYTSLIEGSVVTWKGGNNVVNLVTVADDSAPGVVMYTCPAATGMRPVVVCTKGITLVNMDAATATGDTITTSATTRKGRVNNAAIDPKLILGYAMTAIGAAGLCYARIV